MARSGEQKYESCFLAKLGHYVDLSDSDQQMLAVFEQDEKHFPARMSIVDAGGKVDNIFVVKEGWAVSYTLFPDGRRQNIRVHLPGDVMALSSIAYSHQTIHIDAMTDTTVCPFPKKRIATLFEESPRLGALFMAIAMRDKVALRDTIRMLGRMNAEERLGYFLLDTLDRLRIGTSADRTAFDLPMSQAMVGDTIGISFVSVNRAFRELDSLGLITRQGREVTVARETDLVERCDFHDRYDELDTTWFPDAR